VYAKLTLFKRSMKIFRYVIQNIVFIPTVIISSIVCALLVISLSLFSKKTPLLKKIEYLWARSIVWASGVKVVAELSPLDENKCYIFVSNHLSHLDVPIIMTLLKSFSPRFVAKDTLFKIPLFGSGMKAVGHIPIHRDNKRKALKDLKKAVEIIKGGESVLLFPEGTRNLDSANLLEFQIGAFILAIKLGMEMVPMVIYGTDKCVPKGSIWVRPKTVYVRSFAPLSWPKEYDIKQREELRDITREFMQKKYVELIKWAENKRE